MSVAVITPPSSIMTPADIPGSHTSADAIVQAWIDAAISELDGPDGWLGRAIGVQTLEFRLEKFPEEAVWIPLPCPPIISVTSLTYVDGDGADVVLSGGAYQFIQKDSVIIPATNTLWPYAMPKPGSVRIRYQAGYNLTAVSAGGTGNIPQRIKQSIVLLTQLYKSAGAENLFTSEVVVEGVGSRKFVVSDTAGKVLRESAYNLVSGLRCYW